MITIDTRSVPNLWFLVARRKYCGQAYLVADNRFYEIDDRVDAVLSFCDGARTFADVACALAQAKNMPLTEALSATALVLEYFRREGLVDWLGSESQARKHWSIDSDESQ